ncbi:sn-glycerol-3-phosphate import ATP-binding protein UgpC [Roseovarius salis]|uniref:sn-glycerol-3-phosphate import ATP-binding protein UgpC n=1 Tax=Roseovarius salis TaxID=3376063 RepID=UPI0037CB7B1B
MADIRIDNVRKTYPGGVDAIRGVSLGIEDGEFCVLVGPSGCGKSTLLRMIAGLETVTDGSVDIGGRRVNELEPAERDIAMVFQNYALYPHMSVFDNMAYGLRNRGVPRAEIRRLVDEAAQTLGLSDYLARKPRQLSGGQRQRVAMGRAIVRQPQAFLFDEPLSNLDAKLRIRTRVEIRDLQQRLGTTSIYVTHDQMEAMTLADRLVVLNDGAIEQVGRPIDVYDRPASVFVAEFIGSPPMNILPGRCGPDGVVTRAGVSLGAVDVPDGDVVIGIRPEHLRPDPDGPLKLRVRVVEHLGASANVHGFLPENEAEVIASLPGPALPAPGETLPLAVGPEHLHIFDPGTGRRLR